MISPVPFQFLPMRMTVEKPKWNFTAVHFKVISTQKHSFNSQRERMCCEIRLCCRVIVCPRDDL